MRSVQLITVCWVVCLVSPAARAQSLRVLFLGDNGHHRPAARAEQLIPVMADRQIEITYTEDLRELELENLRRYSALMVYANIDAIAPEQESAILDYVAGGGGFLPLHCASYCFRNSTALVDLMGGQFLEHGGEIFSATVVQPDHPLMRGYSGFRSWDETYIHTKHNPRNRIVLEVRRQGDQAEGRTEEPWTWIRTQGRGRVFYTAWGHDQRTWGHPGFHNLLERGIRWACRDDLSRVADYNDPSMFAAPKMTELSSDAEPFEYVDVGPKIPNYLAGKKWGTQGAVRTAMQRPLSPESALLHYVTPQGFHLELFAAEPQIQGKPIAMNWDERGRLWLCETVDYPNQLRPPGEGRDRIRVCEDTDGDHRADKFTVFADGLSIPTAIEFCRGGVVVQSGTQTLFLRDNDGDYRADERHVLISGWAMGDTHGGVSNFQYGLDNRYWAMQGYNQSQPEYAGGSHPGFRQGPFHFTLAPSSPEEMSVPQVTELEFVRSTTNNSWGLGSTEEGLIFASTANRAPSFFVPIPNRYYERVLGWTPSLLAREIAQDHYFAPVTQNVRQVDHHGGYTAGAGHALYTARVYPRVWWNRTAFVCGPTGHLVGTFVISPDGADFKSQYHFNAVASDDEWSAPIQAEVGPDGQLWIIDWYNYIVQHNPTPKGFTRGKGNAYESDLRDKTRGRIYRLVYDGPVANPTDRLPAQLDPQDPKGLVRGLAHSNRLWRRHAQRLLVERGRPDVAQPLIELIRTPSLDDTGLDPGAIHALWTLHGLQQIAPASPAFEAVVAALQHPSTGVRRNAALVLPAASESATDLVGSGILDDAEPQVRLAALMALADMPEQPAAGRAIAALLTGSLTADPVLFDGIVCAGAAHSFDFLRHALDLDPALVQPRAAEIVRVVAGHHARAATDSTATERLLIRVSRSNSPLTPALLSGLAAGWPDQSATMSADAAAAMIQLLERTPPDDLGPLIQLSRKWGHREISQYTERLIESLLSAVEDDQRPGHERITAAQELVLLSDSPAVISRLLDCVTPQLSPEVAGGLVRSLAGSTADNVASTLLQSWTRLTPGLRQDAMAVLLARPQTTEALLAAMEDGRILMNDLSLEQRQSLTTHPDRSIRRRSIRLQRDAGAVVDADRLAVIERYMLATRSPGNRQLGKKTFLKNCGPCHQHSGEGVEIGPDLTGMAVHPKEELLVHILDPSRSVEGNFKRYTLLTQDDRVLTGMLAAESLSSVELINAEGKRQTISRADIAELKSSNKSMMPEGFEQQLSVESMRDLLEFLTHKGRFVPLPLGDVATAVSTKPLFGRQENGPDRLVFERWGMHHFTGVPFSVLDPQQGRQANLVLLHGPQGSLPPGMPKQVSLPCHMLVRKLHLLSGVSGWGFPLGTRGSTTMVIRIHYEDGQIEDHPLLNGEHFADYIRRVDVPQSQFAFALGDQQLRYLSIQPKRRQPIRSIDLIKGDDASAPMVMAITAEGYE